MAEALVRVLRAHPEVTFFLVLGIGYAIGKVKVAGFTLGAVTGTLLAGVAVGQLDIHVSGDVKQAFLLLFLFSIGFRTGPQFFRGLRRDGLHQAALAAIVATTGLIVAYLMSRLFSYDAGTAAGVIAGSLTQSATIGTASDAIARLGLPPAETASMTNRIAVAFAVTYLVGVVASAWFLSQLAPRLMGVNLEEACRRYEEHMQAGPAHSTSRRDIEYRAYAVLPGSPLIGRTPRALEARAGELRLFIDRIRRRGVIVDPGEAATVEEGDTLAILGRREHVVGRIDEQRFNVREVDDRELLDVPAEQLDVVVTHPGFDGCKVADFEGEEFARAVYLRRILRAGSPVPMFPETKLNRGDVLTLIGPTERLADAARRLGVADRATDITDMVLVAFGIVAGAFVGIPALKLRGIEIGLSLSVGVLLGGLLCGWLRSMWPGLFGRIPSPTLWVFESLGLAGFVAVVGLNSGPEFVAGLQSSAATLLVAGVFTALVPQLVGVTLGHWVLKMEPGVMLGVCAGGGTSTPALAAIQEAAKSPVPTLGYGVAYAVGNVLLALWGTVIVALL